MNCGLRIEWRVAPGPPSLRLPPRAGAGRLYKQTQFAPAGQAGTVRGWSQACETNPISKSGLAGAGGDYAKQDAHDKSRGVTEFTINRYFVWIYAFFELARPSRMVIL